MRTRISEINVTPEIDPYHRDTWGLTRSVLEIDPGTEVRLFQACDDHSTPLAVWHGITLQFNLDVEDGEILDEQALRSYLEDAGAQELLERIQRGQDITWNGNNFVGHINEDASSALEELLQACSACTKPAEIWTVPAYLDDADLGITAQTSDQELEALARSLTPPPPAILVGDVLGYLQAERDRLQHS